MILLAARSVGSGMARLRRAGGPDLASELPYALVGDRLTPWLGDASDEVDAALADALDRLSDSRGEVVTPRVVRPSSAANLSGLAAARGPAGPSDGQRVAAPRGADEQDSVRTDSIRRHGTDAPATRGAFADLAPDEGRSRGGDATFPASVEGPAAASRQFAMGSVEPADGPGIAAAQDAVATPHGFQGAGSSRSAPALRPTLTAERVQVAGDPEVAAELDRLTARRTPVVAEPVALRPAPAAPAELPAAPVARTTPVSAVPPIGLAGLAAWWGDDGPEPEVAAKADPFEPTTIQPSSSRAADSWLSDQRRPEPEGPALLDLAEIDADPLSRFREALEQVLLDEALADGLEVTDGPA